MDINGVKREHGHRVAVGNIFMDDPIKKSPEDIDEEVRIRVERHGADR